MCDASCAAPPLDTAERPRCILLDGAWQFRFEEGKSISDSADPSFKATDTMSVPGCYDMMPKWLCRRGTGLYRRTFALEKPVRNAWLVVDGMGHLIREGINGVVDYLRKRYPDKPILISEMGCCGVYGQHDPAAAQWTEDFEAEYDGLVIDAVLRRRRGGLLRRCRLRRRQGIAPQVCPIRGGIMCKA